MPAAPLIQYESSEIRPNKERALRYEFISKSNKPPKRVIDPKPGQIVGQFEYAPELQAVTVSRGYERGHDKERVTNVK